MDNLDSLLLELEVKEKNKLNQSNQHINEPQKNDQKSQMPKEKANEAMRMSIIEQQKLEIERLKAQLLTQQTNTPLENSVALDFTVPTIINETPKKKRSRNKRNLAANYTPVTSPTLSSYNNFNTKDNISNPPSYGINEKVENNNTSKQLSAQDEEDLELQKLKEELAMEEQKQMKKKEADRLRQEIERVRAMNSGNNNNNNNNIKNDSKNNNTNVSGNNASKAEKEIMAEIERMKLELGSSTDSEKTRIQELEKMKEKLKQELSSIKSSSPAPDPAKEQRIAELERKKLELQRELYTGPSKEELVVLHGQQKRELDNIQFGVDVCFLMDCTKSMKVFIQAAKENIRSIVSQINKIDPRAVLRFAFVGYRDYGDKKQHEILDFVTSSQLELFEKMVGAVVASGGNDPPEDVAGGLQKCTTLTWKASTRLLIHICDAPGHGRRYYPYADEDDRFPHGDPNGLNPEELLKKLLSLRVDYYFLRMHPCTDTMTGVFKNVYDVAKRTFQVHPVNTNPANFLPKVVASIHSSMAQSVSFRK